MSTCFSEFSFRRRAAPSHHTLPDRPDGRTTRRWDYWPTSAGRPARPPASSPRSFPAPPQITLCLGPLAATIAPASASPAPFFSSVPVAFLPVAFLNVPPNRVMSHRGALGRTGGSECGAIRAVAGWPQRLLRFGPLGCWDARPRLSHKITQPTSNGTFPASSTTWSAARTGLRKMRPTIWGICSGHWTPSAPGARARCGAACTADYGCAWR